MLKSISKKRTLEVSIRQASRPALGQLNEYLLQVLERVGERIKFTWLNRKSDQEYELVLQTYPGKGEAQWQLSIVTNHQKPEGLWSYSTCDVLLIHNLIISSCGEGAEDIRAEGAISASRSFRDSSRNDATYFVTAVDDSASIADSKKSSAKSFLSVIGDSCESLAGSSLPPKSVSEEVNAFKLLLDDANAKVPVPLASSPAKEIDRSVIDAVRSCLRDVDTGFHFYPAFLYELEQEYIRSYRNGASFSVILVRARFVDDATKGLGKLELAEIARVLSSLKRGSDLIGYYENGDLAILLPETAGKGARMFARRIDQKLGRDANLKVGGEGSFKVQIGLASIPEDCKNLRVMLTTAERGLERAVECGETIVAHPEQYSQSLPVSV